MGLIINYNIPARVQSKLLCNIVSARDLTHSRLILYLNYMREKRNKRMDEEGEVGKV